MTTESQKGRERRKSPRIAADHEIHFGGEERPPQPECRCINISLGGIYCTLATPVSLYTKMEVSLTLPISDGEGTVREIPVSFEAAVVRIEEPTDPAAGYKAAMVFQNMSDDSEWVIGKYLLQNYRRWRE